MYKQILFTVITINSILGKPEYARPKHERNNILNKGVWVRNKDREEKRHIFEKGEGDFLFLEENSLDRDNNMQYNFDPFGGTDTQDPMVPTYVDRVKRSNKHIRKERSLSTTNKCKDSSCTNQISDSYENQSGFANSRIINDLRPASVFNDYPYEVAILLSTNSSEIDSTKNKTNNVDKITADILNIVLNDSSVVKNETTPKRSMKNDYESKIIKKIEFTEDVTKPDKNNVTDNKISETLFDKNIWHDLSPVPDINIYKIMSKEKQNEKPLTEKGLVKIITMLTKTFKKIVKQHNDIKRIHAQINEVNNNFAKNSNILSHKFADFDLKYLYLLKFNEKVKQFEAKLANKEEYFNNKEKEMAKSFKEFEKQQKKFLQQQRQFFNIQKLMLAQNERINLKQNVIAKSQSEISHRQNAFARILKKAKQLYIDSKNSTSYKLSTNLVKSKDNNRKYHDTTTSTVETPSTTPTSTTESIKIDLFSIPISNKIEDQDDLIMQEKDEQTIDDLVYKYYFNNTYIDNFMKNKILANFLPNSEPIVPKYTKRNVIPETTLLFPISELNVENQVPKNRKRRWINHHSNRKHKRRYRGKQEIAPATKTADDKVLKNNNIPVDQKPVQDTVMNKDPFLSMATNFCNEVQHKNTSESLALCIEKVIRKLSNMNYIMSPFTVTEKSPVAIKSQNSTKQEMSNTTQIPITHSTLVGMTLATGLTSSTSASLPQINTANIPEVTKSTGTPFIMPIQNFPDNEILESNLKQYVIDPKPDVEGNVYYEGSVHASQMADKESQGIDDLMPGMESNSRFEVDPVTFDLQARRRAFVRQLNERIKKTLG